MKRSWPARQSMKVLGGWLLGVCLLLPAPRVGGQGADLGLTTQTRAMSLRVGQSQVFEPDWRIRRVSVGEPKIADVQVLNANRLLVLGKSPGTTDLALWDENERLSHFRVEVDPDLDRLQRDLAQLFPGSQLRMAHSQGVYVMTGTVENAETAERIQKMMEQMGIKFVNLARMPGLQQVKLKVRVAEVNRNAIRQLGVNAIKAGDDFFGGLLVGPANGGAFNPVSIGPLRGAPATGTPSGAPSIFGFPTDTPTNPLVTLLAGFPNSDLELFIQALAENQYIRILAEPTLIALSGEEARFLAGGEYPIPVVQGTSGSGISVSIEYKEFGVRLRFQPTVMGNGAIRMHVAPEVSDLSDVGAVEIQGFRVPTLLTRRAETTLEMKDGQTFAIAGLLNQTSRARNSRIPGLGAIPVVGALFRNVRHEAMDTELMVLVRAELVEPMSTAKEPPVPGEAERRPNNWELYGLGQLEGKGSGQLSPEQAAWLKARQEGEPQGAVPQGVVSPGVAPQGAERSSPGQADWLKAHHLNELSGPGAWASHGVAESAQGIPAAVETK